MDMFYLIINKKTTFYLKRWALGGGLANIYIYIFTYIYIFRSDHSSVDVFPQILSSTSYLSSPTLEPPWDWPIFQRSQVSFAEAFRRKNGPGVWGIFAGKIWGEKKTHTHTHFLLFFRTNLGGKKKHSTNLGTLPKGGGKKNTAFLSPR